MRAVGFCVPLLLCACSRLPTWYAPPEQVTTSSAPDPIQEIRKVTMSDPDSLYSILEGISDAGRSEYKWTSGRVRLQLVAGGLTNTDFFMHYWLTERTLRDTGPVRITVTIDGQAFDTFVERAAGEHVYKHPAGGIASEEVRPLNVTVTFDPPWIDKDGSKIGALLESIGLVPQL